MTSEPRACACGTALGKRNKSGRCRPCTAVRVFSSPQARTNQAAALRKRLADPVVRAEHCARSQERLAKWRAENAEAHAAASKIGMAAMRALPPEVEARRRLAIRRTMLAGIPEDRWDEYKDLAHRMGAAEARRVVLDDVAAQDRRRMAAMTPLERQLERVRKGATVVDMAKVQRWG